MLSGRCMTPGGPGTQHAKNRIYFFSRKIFDKKKLFFFKNFFFALNSIDQLSNALLYIASGSLKRKRRNIKVINPPLALSLESPSSYYSISVVLTVLTLIIYHSLDAHHHLENSFKNGCYLLACWSK